MAAPFPPADAAAGQVVVMDNLNVHKGAQVRQIIEGAGCGLVYLPAYSPDFSPIEGAYSKVKTRVRRAAKRTQEELVAAIGEAVGAVTANDARGWFTHCGYSLPPDNAHENRLISKPPFLRHARFAFLDAPDQHYTGKVAAGHISARPPAPSQSMPPPRRAA